MKTICLEIRDAGTFIPAMATQLTCHSEDTFSRYLLRRAGYDLDHPSIVLTNLNSGESANDEYNWNTGARTMPIAHRYIRENFSKLSPGDVIDVQYIIGESKIKKQSERETVECLNL